MEWWDPPLAADAAWYDNSEHYLSTPYITWLGWSHARSLDELPQRTRTLLDIGCADGRFVYAAALKGIDAHGIDHSVKMVEVGNARNHGSRLSTTSIEQFSAADQSFDAVTLFDVVEHVVEPLELLRLARSVTRTGGVVIVGTPNRLGYPWGKHPMDRPPHHLTRWTPAALRAALERAGFTRVRIVTSPGRHGLRQVLMDRLSFGLVAGALRRRREAAAGSGEAPASASIGLAIILKDRAVRIVAAFTAPLVGRRYAGGAMIAIAERTEP